MNRGNLNKILIVVAILVWGSGLYKYSKNRNFDSDKGSKIATKIKVNPMPTTHLNKGSAFVLLDRDPFLDESLSGPTTTISTSNNYNNKNSRKILVHTWPTIEFFGFVKSENKKHPLALIKINGSLERMRPGRIDENFRIDAIYSDSIIISNGKQKKKFIVK